MTQPLRELAAHGRGPRFSSWYPTNQNSSTKKSHTLFWDLWAPGMLCGAHILEQNLPIGHSESLLQQMLQWG